jgi:hypothetical protein
MQTLLKSEKEFDEFKSWTYGLLRDPQLETLCITFTKKDGTERKMFCTLAESKIPTDKLPKGESEAGSQTTGSAVRVFDVEVQEWRSFRWDSVIKVEFSLGA